MADTEQNFTIRRGEKWSVDFYFLNADGTQQDITGSTFTFVTRTSPVEAPSIAPLLQLVSGGIEAEGDVTVDADLGLVSVVLTPATTGNLQSCWWALWKDATGVDDEPVALGRLFAQPVVRVGV